MGLFLWMPCLAPTMWSTTYSHWWHLIFIAHGCHLFGLSWVSKHVKTWWNGWVPFGQSYFHICHIGNHHVSLWTMFLKNFKHCNRLYIFFIFCCIVLCFDTTLTWGFHNIFIVHGKHTNVGCTMARLFGVKILPNFSLHMACVEIVVLAFHGKNQGFKGEACSTWSPPHGDVHVHQPRWNHW